MKLNGKLFKEIAELLKTASGTVNCSIKSLRYALVTTNHDSIQFESTDLDNGIRITIPKNEISETDMDISSIPITDMKNFATKSKAMDDIEIRKNSLINGKVTKKFNDIVSKDGFPTIDYLSKGINHSNSLPFDFFRETVNYISDFAAKDDYRPTLNGIAFVPKRNEIVATDGHVLTCKKNVPFENTNENSYIVNPDINKILKKIKSTVKDNIVKIETKGSTIVFTFITENYTMSIYSRLIEGEYPPYYKVYPDSRNIITEYELECNNLKKVDNFFDGGETNQVKIHVKEDKTVTFSEDIEDYNTTIEGKVISENTIPEHTYGVNYKYAVMFIRKGMAHLPIAFTDSHTAIIIEDDEYKNLLMPVRLDRA